jgi:hypothetical protein
MLLILSLISPSISSVSRSRKSFCILKSAVAMASLAGTTIKIEDRVDPSVIFNKGWESGSGPANTVTKHKIEISHFTKIQALLIIHVQFSMFQNRLLEVYSQHQ